MTEPVNLEHELAKVSEYWSPREVGQVNETALQVVRLKGEFEEHVHDGQDECFLVLDGELTVDLPDGPRVVRPGEFLVVPRDTPHRPHCADEVRILLIEPADTVQYGDLDESAPVRARGTA